LRAQVPFDPFYIAGLWSDDDEGDGAATGAATPLYNGPASPTSPSYTPTIASSSDREAPSSPPEADGVDCVASDDISQLKVDEGEDHLDGAPQAKKRRRASIEESKAEEEEEEEEAEEAEEEGSEADEEAEEEKAQKSSTSQ
jgi:hypothetical protein